MFCKLFNHIKSYPPSVEILSASCFSNAKFNVIIPDNESRLRRINDLCFWTCAMRSICVPRSVEFVGRSCFAGSSFPAHALSSIFFESGLKLTRLAESWFAQSSIRSLCIPQSVVSIAKWCFCHCKQIGKTSFEPQSQVKQIEESDFSLCSIKSIVLPGSLEILGKACFEHSNGGNGSL